MSVLKVEVVGLTPAERISLSSSSAWSSCPALPHACISRLNVRKFAFTPLPSSSSYACPQSDRRQPHACVSRSNVEKFAFAPLPSSSSYACVNPPSAPVNISGEGRIFRWWSG
eukprot:4755350-Pyramimonas_sp.AAC.2